MIPSMSFTAQVENGGAFPNLGDDALLYAGSATWEDWRNHIPNSVRHAWKSLSDESRLVAFLIAKSFTHYKADVGKQS